MVLEHYARVHRALIGHTGFVGSNLDRATRFDARFNSRSIKEIEGRHFDEIVCAGVSAKKWLANKEPDDDWAAIAALIRRLETVTTERFVLVSTIDVYPDPGAEHDESFDPRLVPNHPYGTHRLKLEEWVQGRFRAVNIVRLPALFGPNLMKNALFDLLNDNQVDQLNPAAIFQWYPVKRLWDDIETAKSANLQVVNLFTEPLPLGRIVDQFFPGAPVGKAKEPAPRYQLRTRHAEIFGQDGPWMMNAQSVLDEMRKFVGKEQ